MYLDGNQQYSNTQEGYAWSWKPSQISRASDIMVLRGEPTTTALLSQHNPWLHSTYLFLDLQMSAVFTPSQGNVSLQQMETITVNQSKCSYRAQLQHKPPTHLRLRHLYAYCFTKMEMYFKLLKVCSSWKKKMTRMRTSLVKTRVIGVFLILSHVSDSSVLQSASRRPQASISQKQSDLA